MPDTSNKQGNWRVINDALSVKSRIKHTRFPRFTAKISLPGEPGYAYRDAFILKDGTFLHSFEFIDEKPPDHDLRCLLEDAAEVVCLLRNASNN
ncbi:hypothetical protein [Desulfohalovibrio reitneri]|uniref:hypothetical protein n=1 Tax=Desulfohalovibrio reitneri TaxID=1307759 RepID=UPI0004A73782|nr:hypothetical protein [Desulfohalovibrio reitneri]